MADWFASPAKGLVIITAPPFYGTVVPTTTLLLPSFSITRTRPNTNTDFARAGWWFAAPPANVIIVETTILLDGTDSITVARWCKVIGPVRCTWSPTTT